MTAKAKSALAASIAATFLAGSAYAAPLLNIKIEGRLGTTGDFSSTLDLSGAGGAAGQTINYRVTYDMAAVGTMNENAQVVNPGDPIRNNPTGVIKSLTLSPTVEDPETGDQVANPLGDGVNALTLDIFQLASDPVAGDVLGIGAASLNTDPTAFPNDSWAGGTGSSGGVRSPSTGIRAGVPAGTPVGTNARDRVGVRSIHVAGLQTAVDAEQVFTGTFVLPTAPGVGGSVLLNGRVTPGSSGVIKINGTGDPIFITGTGAGETTEGGTDPLVSIMPLTITLGGVVGGDKPILTVAADGNFGNLLLNAAASRTATINKTEPSTPAAATFSLAAAGDATVGSAGGTIPANTPTGTFTFGVNTSTVGAKTGTVTLSNTSPGTGTDPDDVINVTATVGQLGANAASVLVASGGSYAGLGGTSSVGLNTVASLLAGTNAGGDTTVTMSAAARTGSDPVPPNVSELASDRITIGGIDDAVVLQLSYNPDEGNVGNLPDDVSAALGVIFVARLQDGLFRNAGTGAVNLGAYADIGAPGPGDEVGRFGVDAANNVAWVVINSGGEFAVVPEPATLSLLSLGALGLLARRRRA